MKTLANTNPLTDLELFELIVAAYPEKFAEREAAGDDIWDEVMEFIEGDLCGEELQDWHGLARLLGRIAMLTIPAGSVITGQARHCLGAVEIRDGQAFMTAAVKRNVMIEAPPMPASSPNQRQGIEWAISRCKALQAQGFKTTRHDVLIKDFEGCLSAQTKKTALLEPGLRLAIARCQALLAKGFTHSEHDALIKDFESCIEQQEPGAASVPACWNCHQRVSMAERAEADGNCPHCSAELDLDTWPAK